MSTHQINYTPMLSIAPTYSTIYYDMDYEQDSKTASAIKTLRHDITQVDNTDKFSDNSRKKLKNYIDWFVEQSKVKMIKNGNKNLRILYKIGFLTLTLPFEQHYSDQEIKSKLLNQFFVEARKRWNLHNYIWRAEKQKNGNIHFHVLVDVFIPWKECRQVWNRICDKLDLVSLWSARMKEKFEFGFTATQEELKTFGLSVLKRRYKEGKKNGWTDPNSVDIHSLQNIKNIGSYVTKYMAKKEDEQLKQFEPKPGAPLEIVEQLEQKKAEYLSKKSITGRYWYVSERIKKYCVNMKVVITDTISNTINTKFDDLRELIKDNGFIRVYKNGISKLRKCSTEFNNLINDYIERIRLLLSNPHNCNCLENIRNMKINFLHDQPKRKKIQQLNLFHNV